MKKLLVKYSLISTLLAAIALCLLGLPFNKANADPPEPTPSPALDIRTRLQPYQTLGVEPSQSDGRLFEEAPLPSEMEEPPIGPLAQQTFYSYADATVLQGYPSQNLGSTTDMWAGYDEYLEPDGRIARSLIRCDITGLPANIDITQATFRIYLVSSWDYPNTSRTITTYRITSSWSENNVTWNNRPGYGSPYGSRSIVHGAWGWYEFDVTDLVRAWHDGTYTNHGIMLRGPEVSGYNASWRGFGTRESSYEPRLVVEYVSGDIPEPPTNLTATPVSQTEINLSWQDNSSNETGFKIERSPNGTTNWAQIATVGANVTTYANTGLTCNTTCHYRVRAYNASGDSNYSNTANATTSDCSYSIYLPITLKNAGPPSAPVLDPIDNSDGDGSYTVSWSSVNGATEYVLQEDDNASFTSPTTVYSGASTSTTITGRDIGTYYYRVQATNSFGSSSWSNRVSTTVTQTAVVPKPGYWSGGSVSFEVSSDSSTVEWFELDVYVSGCGWYTLTWYDMAITDGQFSKGEFTTPTSASGSCSYFFEACNGWVFGLTSWSATWQHY